MERGELVIARILHGGMVAQQGLLHVGDVIREVNGREVGSDPRALQDSLRHASGSVVLKILPSYQEPHPPRQVPACPACPACPAPRVLRVLCVLRVLHPASCILIPHPAPCTVHRAPFMT